MYIQTYFLYGNFYKTYVWIYTDLPVWLLKLEFHKAQLSFELYPNDECTFSYKRIEMLKGNESLPIRKVYLLDRNQNKWNNIEQ